MGILRYGRNLSATDKVTPSGLAYCLESSPSPYTALDDVVKTLSRDGPLVGVRIQLVAAKASDDSQVFCVLGYGTPSQ